MKLEDWSSRFNHSSAWEVAAVDIVVVVAAAAVGIAADVGGWVDSDNSCCFH